MDGPAQLVYVISTVFGVAVLALFVQLIYVLWRRRIFRRRSDSIDPNSSKEQMLYFFCWKTPARIEPAGNHTIRSPPDAEPAVDDDDVAKWQEETYGPSRALFTIKEEEREETETKADNDGNSIKTACTESEGFSKGEVVVNIEASFDEVTPFSTPCASPPYYTPSPSPTHDKYSSGDGEGS